MSDGKTPTRVTPAQLASRGTLDNIMRELSAGGDSFSVLMVDVNHLADLNDSAGRERGDQILEMVTAMLTDFAGEEFPLVHLGEDDFALLLPNTNRMQAVIAGTRIQGKAVMSGVDTGDWELLFNVGVATSDEAEPGALLVKAEERLLREMERLNGKSEQRVALRSDKPAD